MEPRGRRSLRGRTDCRGAARLAMTGRRGQTQKALSVKSLAGDAICQLPQRGSQGDVREGTRLAMTGSSYSFSSRSPSRSRIVRNWVSYSSR